MKIEELNDIKKRIVDFVNDVTGLPDDIKDGVVNALNDAKKMINDVGMQLEKYTSDTKNTGKLKQDTLDKMKKSPFFLGFPQDKLEKTADRIINSNDLVVLDETSFNDYLNKELGKMPTETLFKYGYSKEQVLSIGKRLADPKATETEKYERGKEAIMSSIRTPSGIEQATDFAVQRINKNPSLKNYFTSRYYGL